MADRIYVTPAQLQEVTNEALSKVSDKGYLTSVDDYTITQQQQAESGYAATYQLFKGDTAVGDKINIPKDFLVKAATLEVVTTADTPYTGAQVGDKYIDFTINTVDSSASATHIYLPVNDLVDVYTGGNGIDVSNLNVVSIEIDSSNANGLSVGANGLALATAQSASGNDPATAGAMSAADKAKLDAADVTAYTAGNGVDITSHEVSAVIVAGNGLSLGSSGIAMSTAQSASGDDPATAGAMSATDKQKLDEIRVASAAEITAVKNALVLN